MNKLNAATRLLEARDIQERLARLRDRRTGTGEMTPKTARHEDTAIEEQVETPVHPVDPMDVQCEEPLDIVAAPLSTQVERMDQKLQQQDAADAEFKAKEQEKATKADQKARLGAGRGTGFGAGVLLMAADTGRIFLAKRSDRGDEGGTWCCGGGGVEDYETIEEAARRENMEELGFDLTGVPLLHMHRSVQPGFIFHNHMAVIPHELEARLNDEHSECGWFSDLPEPMHPKLMEAINTWAANHADNELVKQAQAEEMANH